MTNHQPGVKTPVYVDDLTIITLVGSPTIHSHPTQRAYSIRLPMRIKTSSKKHTALNLNVYRNLHHRSHHALKKKFEELAENLLKDTPPLGKIRLHYSVCPQTRRRLDIANVCSVIDKYFSDALTANGIIEDDDYTHLDFVSFGFGGLADEEHVLVTITEIEEREPMKLSMTATLSADDIMAAIAAWVAEETGQTVDASSVTLDESVTATVEIDDDPAPAKPARKKRRTRAQIEAEKAAEEAEDNEQTGTSGSDSDSAGPGEPAEEQAEETSDEAPEAEAEESGAAEDKQPKNASEGSQEESSTTDSASEDDAPAPVKKRKKSSIFDQ